MSGRKIHSKSNRCYFCRVLFLVLVLQLLYFHVCVFSVQDQTPVFPSNTPTHKSENKIFPPSSFIPSTSNHVCYYTQTHKSENKTCYPLIYTIREDYCPILRDYFPSHIFQTRATRTFCHTKQMSKE